VVTVSVLRAESYRLCFS